MTFAYYAGPEAVKGLQKFHDKGKKVTKNAPKKLDSILLPEFYRKVAEVMQEETLTTNNWFLCFSPPPKELFFRCAAERQFWAHFDNAT